jgi:hypothetical protein
VRRKTPAIFLILIFGSLAVAWFLLPQTNNNPTQSTKVAQAKIKDFIMDGSQSGPLVGVTYGIPFNVTIQNIGNINISDATVLIERIATDNVTGLCSYDTQNVTLLHPGETQMIRLCILVNLDNLGKVGTSNFLATLSVNRTVLDERKLF